MTDRPNNPPAFPRAAKAPGQWPIDAEGMTLRDYFAGQALAWAAHAEWFNNNAEDEAARAYRMADAMLAERMK